jgi:hypothetical protein
MSVHLRKEGAGSERRGSSVLNQVLCVIAVKF